MFATKNISVLEQSEQPRRRYLKRKRFRRFRRRVNLRKGLHLLPNLFTFGNAFFGFSSIVSAASGDLVASAYFILLGALMDMLDGRIARLIGISSELGAQLDSLSDAISFCLAPAFLVYVWKLKTVGFLGFFACVLFLLAGLLRLARFNLTSQEQKHFFIGTPSTFAGCFLVTVFLNARNTFFNPMFLFLLLCFVIVLAYLMISTVRFPTFKYVHKSRVTFAVVVATAFAAIMGLLKVLVFIFSIYFMYALGAFFHFKITRSKKRSRNR